MKLARSNNAANWQSQWLSHRLSRRQRGFTLIEMLVSLTISAVVLGLLGAGIRTISQGWDRSADRLGAQDMLQRGIGLLRRDISGMRRLVSKDRGPARFIFEGGAARLAFVTLEPAYPTRPGLYLVRYAVQRAGRGASLVRSRAKFGAGSRSVTGAAFTDAVSVVDGPYRFGFSYGAARRGTVQWFRTWPDSARLPDLIRLEIAAIVPTATPLPPVIIAIAANAEASCVLPNAEGCTIQSFGKLNGRKATPPPATGGIK